MCNFFYNLERWPEEVIISWPASWPEICLASTKSGIFCAPLLASEKERASEAGARQVKFFPGSRFRFHGAPTRYALGLGSVNSARTISWARTVSNEEIAWHFDYVAGRVRSGIISTFNIQQSSTNYTPPVTSSLLHQSVTWGVAESHRTRRTVLGKGEENRIYTIQGDPKCRTATTKHHPRKLTDWDGHLKFLKINIWSREIRRRSNVYRVLS